MSLVTSNGYRLIKEGIPDLLPMQGRSPGLHVSKIVSDICVAKGYFPKNQFISPTLKTRWQLGCAFEDTIARRYLQHDPNRFIQLGEVTKDGISGTSDWVDCRDETQDEMKLTWYSAKKMPGDNAFAYYDMQLKSYCYMHGFDRGRLHVCHVNGHYYWMSPHPTKEMKDNDGPTYRVWEKRFTRAELVANWAMIRAYGDEILRRNGV